VRSDGYVETIWVVTFLIGVALYMFDRFKGSESKRMSMQVKYSLSGDYSAALGLVAGLVVGGFVLTVILGFIYGWFG
jgi:hypothetical protein